MQQLNHLPIWRDANRLLLGIEQAVRQFPRYHKYTLGTDLRRQAMTVCRLILRAADKGEGQRARVTRVVEAVDDLKIQIQLGKELQAFHSFRQFQELAELAVAVGKQSGGWRKSARLA
ncbi:MAG: four helix bundle protein [Thiocapsa sp.]|uniref:four helix bundle protein n=1 Tax=Thiocapsa sp. TaxID=2024551 RepID=UPI001BCB349B|nr:four helix bundle protein [Thiocapsa sp.]QVL49252.1 MAG: four helix bundle protein [Thiocapsa sp.]